MLAALKMYKENPVRERAQFTFSGEQYSKLKNLPVTRRLGRETKNDLEEAEATFRSLSPPSWFQEPPRQRMDQRSRRNITIDEIVELGNFGRASIEEVYELFDGNKENIIHFLLS